MSSGFYGRKLKFTQDERRWSLKTQPAELVRRSFKALYCFSYQLKEISDGAYCRAYTIPYRFRGTNNGIFARIVDAPGCTLQVAMQEVIDSRPEVIC